MVAGSRKKTCGTCANYYEVRPTMEQGSCLIDELDEHGCAPLHDSHEKACVNWEPKPITAEERCQQLERLAVDMYSFVIERNTPDVPGVDMSGFEERLEELGVSLDDCDYQVSC